MNLPPATNRISGSTLSTTISGAGLNIVVQDLNKDGKPDIVVANKNGVFLFENQIRK
ncbi:hypothetical protein GCM10027347_14350 [Larkinella harenae]